VTRHRPLRAVAAIAIAVAALVSLLATPAAAHDQEWSGRVYYSDTSDCTDFSNFMSEFRQHTFSTYTFLAYSYFGAYTAACATRWNRPAGNIAVKAEWRGWTGSQQVTCAYTNWVHNSATASSVTFSWAGSIETLCDYPTYSHVIAHGSHYGWNGAWHGGGAFSQWHFMG
jgi:hypothetical protein